VGVNGKKPDKVHIDLLKRVSESHVVGIIEKLSYLIWSTKLRLSLKHRMNSNRDSRTSRATIIHHFSNKTIQPELQNEKDH